MGRGRGRGAGQGRGPHRSSYYASPAPTPHSDRGPALRTPHSDPLQPSLRGSRTYSPAHLDRGRRAGAPQAAGSGPGPRVARRGHRCPGRRIPPPAPPGPAWAGRRYLGAGGWGRAGARGALSTRLNGGAGSGPGRGAAGRGARGAAPRGVLPCGALSTLPERARSSLELRPAQLPANL